MVTRITDLYGPDGGLIRIDVTDGEPPHCRSHIQFRSDCDRCVSAREFA